MDRVGRVDAFFLSAPCQLPSASEASERPLFETLTALSSPRTNIFISYKSPVNFQAQPKLSLYPTSSPLTLSTIERWFSFHAEFGFVFISPVSSMEEETGDKTVGTCVIVALTRPGWEQLVRGELSESQLDESVLFQAQRDDELGIHVYHVERLDGWAEACAAAGPPSGSASPPNVSKKISIAMLHELARVLGRLDAARAGAGRPPLRVCGFSGLCVTPGGFNLFGTVYNCRERDAYVCQEYILRRQGGGGGEGELRVVQGLDQGGLDAALERGWELVTRAQMLVLVPGEVSIVWSILNNGRGRGD